MNPLPDPERVVSALLATGWTFAGQRAGLYKRLYWPGVTDLRGRSIIVPLDPDFADYRDLMAAALGELELAAEVGELELAAEVGRTAAEALRVIAAAPNARPIDAERMCDDGQHTGWLHPAHTYDVLGKHLRCPGAAAAPGGPGRGETDEQA